MLKINQLHAGYNQQNFILKDFSMHLQQGEHIGIIGPNGCGKSTLAKAIMGQAPHTKGKILWQGKNLNHTPLHQKNRLGIAYFMQGGRVFGNLSVRENLKTAWHNNAKYDTMADAIASLQRFNLPLFSDTNRLKLTAENLSGGEKHILSFAMVLLSCPQMKLLIADEPSAGVAQIGQKQILNLMTKVLKQTQTALILIEQNRDFLKQLTNKTIEIKAK